MTKQSTANTNAKKSMFPGSCHSVGLAKALRFVNAKKVTAAISFFGAVNTLAFWTPSSGPPQLRWKPAQSKPNFDPLAWCEELCASSSLQGYTAKNGIATRCRFSVGEGHSEAVFTFYFNGKRDQKRARQIHVGACGNPVFGCDMMLRTRPAASKVHQK